MPIRPRLAASVAFLVLLSACSASGSGDTATRAPDTTAANTQGVSTTDASSTGAVVSDTAAADAGNDSPSITSRDENYASVTITVGGESFTEDLEGDGWVTCTTYGAERDTATLGLYLEGERVSASSSDVPGTTPGTYTTELTAYSLDDTIDGLLGGPREGTATVTLDRVVEIAGNVAGNLWLFEGSLSGTLDDGGPEATVEASFACIGLVSWSFTP